MFIDAYREEKNCEKKLTRSQSQDT